MSAPQTPDHGVNVPLPVLGGHPLGAPIEPADPDPELLTGEGCGLCGWERCVTVASVSWDSAPEFADGQDWMIVGRGCLWDAVRYAEGRVSDRGRITVTLPVWRGPLAAEQAGVSYRQMTWWVHLGLVRPEEEAHPGSGYQHRFLADQVVRLRRLGELTAVDIPPRTAARLLDADPDAAVAVVKALDTALAVAA